MEKFRAWPLLDRLLDRYWNEERGWTPHETWATEDLVNLEVFANGELQRRYAEAQGKEITYVRDADPKLH
jgi:hypothetical protein